MKIVEILQEKVEKEMVGKIPLIHLPPNSTFDKKSLVNNFLGKGKFASAYDHPKSSNTIIKIANLYDPKRDGQIRFVNMVLNNPNNPFFPKIYNAKIYQSDKKAILVIQMEKLHELDNMKLRDNIEPILNSLGITPDIIKHDPQMKRVSAMLNGDMQQSLFHLFKDEESVKALLKASTNPMFKKAVQTVISTNKEDTISSLDLHTGNFMFRLTSVGPQLVVTDPFL